MAMISLTYSMDRGTDSSGILTSSGKINASSLECYRDSILNLNCPTAPETPQSLAHAYGEITTALVYCSYTTDDDIKAAPQDCAYFGKDDGEEFAYRYMEYSLSDPARAYPYLTNRIIRASPGDCYQYSVGNYDEVDSTDGIQGTRIYQFYNATYNGSLPIPRPSEEFDSTTFIWNGTATPIDETVQSCGPRCVWLYAYQGLGIMSKRPSLIFQCPITVGEVSNTNQSAHRLSDENARLAGASIALSGRYTNPDGLDKPSVWEQYQLYSWG